MSTSVTGAENGTRAVVMGCACVIFSSLTPDEIKRFKALHPEALKMEKEEGGTSFSIDTICISSNTCFTVMHKTITICKNVIIVG